MLTLACALTTAKAAKDPIAVAGKPAPRVDDERGPIAVLKSSAPPAEKAIACKQLAVCGTSKAVPALEPLLSDKALASWARIALEAIPGSAPDAALRKALPKLKGKLLVGAINSIAVRRDANAVKPLIQKLNDSDAEVAAAAAIALGHLGGPKASAALQTTLAKAPTAAVAEGCVLCAESLLNHGRLNEAANLYDAVRAASVPKQKVLEATRGAILARQSAGIPLLLEQLRSADKAHWGIGLRTARELPGADVTEALAAELTRCNEERQAFLLLALGDRTDAAVMPAVLKAAHSGPDKLRITAVNILDRLGYVPSTSVLLEAAANGSAELSRAALTALGRLPGAQVDEDLLGRLPSATGKRRKALIQVAEQRRLSQALPALVSSAGDADPGVRAAAVQAIGALGEEKHAADLAKLLEKTPDAKDRENIEMALIAISGRAGAGCVPSVLPLEKSSDSGVRVIGLHALAAAGGPGALAAVKSALEDSDENVQDEAVRTLSTWPNNWPEDSGMAEPLLTLARSGKKTSHQVLGLRGYLQYVRGDKKLSDADKITKVSDVTPLLKKPEEQRSAIAILESVATPAALEQLTALAADSAAADDACSAMMKLMGKKDLKGVSREQRQKTLQTVVEKASDETLKKQAEGMLKEGK